MSYVYIKDVSKIFDDKIVIDKLSFNIEKGQFVSIIGKYGTGKTTILRMIAGLESIDGGEVSINNRSPLFLRNERKIGFAFQDSNLLPWRNVVDNITLPTEIQGDRNTSKAARLLRVIGLEDKANSHPYELSGGMQKMISILRAAVLDPEILILDEPFSSIDEISRDDLHEKLINIHNEDHKTTILVTHSIHEAVYLSDKIFILGETPSYIIKTVAPLYPRMCSAKFNAETLGQVAEIRKFLQEVNQNA